MKSKFLHLRRAALIILLAVFSSMFFTACGSVGGSVGPSGSRSYTYSNDDPADLSNSNSSIGSASERPSEGTVLVYDSSLTGKLLSGIGSSYTYYYKASATVNGKNNYMTDYYTTNGTKEYIDRVSNVDDDLNFTNMHVVFCGNKVGYSLNDEDKTAVKYTNDCLPISDMITIIKEQVNGCSFISGQEAINGVMYYSESATGKDDIIYTFYYNSSNGIKYIKLSYDANYELIELYQLLPTFTEKYYTLKGYTVWENVGGVVMTYPAPF